MEHKKKYAATAILSILAAVAITAAVVGVESNAPQYTLEERGIRFDNWISVEVIHDDGSREETIYAKNLVTNEGLNWIRDALSGLEGDITDTNRRNWSVIELSTSVAAPAGGDTACVDVITGNGLDIQQATTIYNQPGNGNYTASATFSVTGGTTHVQKVCLSNNTATASSDLMASALITNTTVQSGDTLIINYSVAATTS